MGAAKRDEHLLRLGLAALAGTCRENTSMSEDSVIDVTASTCLDSVSMIDEESFIDGETPVSDCRRLQVQGSRIGIDIGDVITCASEREMWEVPGAIDAICLIASIFGSSNVFLVSRVHLGGRMHERTREWLHRRDGLVDKAGLKKENIVFVS